jgi:hypothetical protein
MERGSRGLGKSQGVPGRDLRTAAASAQRLERLPECGAPIAHACAMGCKRQAPLDGLRGFLPPADFGAKTLEAERPGPFDLRVVRVAPEAVARFARLARGAQYLFPGSGYRARPIRPSIVECKLSCHW